MIRRGIPGASGRRAARVRLAGIAALGLAAAGLGHHAAGAQTVSSGVGINPSQQANQTPAPVPEHLFGNWGGLRAYLDQHGIDLKLDWTTEFAGNVSGGAKQGATYAGQVGFQADIDWGKLAGLTGFSTHLIVVNRQGSSDSALFGDNLIPVQEIYGSGGNVLVHLVAAYAEQSLMGGKVDVAAGRMPVLNDFAASPLYCNFMNNSLCGNPKTLPGADVGMTSWPDATFGGRVRVRPVPQFYLQAGLYEVNQAIYTYPQFRSGFDWSGSGDTGVEVPVEVGYEPHYGPERLPGHYKLGFGFDSSSYREWAVDAFGPGAPASGLPAKMSSNKTTAWALADQMLVRNGPGDDDGLIALGAYAHGDPATSVYDDQFTLGLLDRGFWRARPADTTGLLFTYQTVSGALGKQQGLEAEFGLPFANGATGIQTHEEVLEVNYDIHVAPGVNFQPEFQYVFRPNAQANLGDAAVFGFKAHVDF